MQRLSWYLAGILLFVAPCVWAEKRPWAEFERTKYVALSYDSLAGRFTDILSDILKNLPADVRPILFISDDQMASKVQTWIQEIGGNPDAVFLTDKKILRDYGNTGRWNRDALPYPIVDTESPKGYSLVDSAYLRWEPDHLIMNQFQLPLVRMKLAFEYGNFAADQLGNCFTRRGRADKIPDSIFASNFGCKSVTRIQSKGGARQVQHLDEVMKVISNQVVVTDQPQVVSQLQATQYQVVKLPRPDDGARKKMPQRTYVNSLIVNGHVFVPTFGVPADQEAIDIYASLGFKVIPVRSERLADSLFGGLGSVHCLTMGYPEI